MSTSIHEPPAFSTTTATTVSAWVPALAGPTAAAVGWVVLVPFGGVELTVDTGAGPTGVGVASVLLAGLVGGVGALAVGRLARRGPRPRVLFLAATVTLLVVSLLVGPTAATTVGGGLGLGLLHLLVGAVVIPLAARRLPRDRTPSRGA